jgi:hypothetical protein
LRGAAGAASVVPAALFFYRLRLSRADRPTFLSIPLDPPADFGKI